MSTDMIDAVVVPGGGIGAPASRPLRHARPGASPELRMRRAPPRSALSHTGVRTKANCGGIGGGVGKRLEKGRRCHRARIGIVGVVAGKHFENERGVGERAREHADMVERARQHQRAGARDHPMRRLDAIDAAEGRRPDHRAIGLRADCERHHAGGDRRRRTGRRAARRARGVMRVARRTRMEIGEFRGHRLADDHRAGFAQPRDGGRNRASADGP